MYVENLPLRHLSVIRKRKQVSEAERAALELSKLASKDAQESGVQIENHSIVFSEPKTVDLNSRACNWKDPRQVPCYCKHAEFRFEASLPDRKHLTRYSVRCLHCYNESETTFHLYCSYCDEILTGSIAGPGGKVTDHVITIRHVYKEALALQAYFEKHGISDVEKTKEYVAKLEHWLGIIRFPRATLKKLDFECIIKSVKSHLQLKEDSKEVQDNSTVCKLEPEVEDPSLLETKDKSQSQKPEPETACMQQLADCPQVANPTVDRKPDAPGGAIDCEPLSTSSGALAKCSGHKPPMTSNGNAKRKASNKDTKQGWTLPPGRVRRRKALPESRVDGRDTAGLPELDHFLDCLPLTNSTLQHKPPHPPPWQAGPHDMDALSQHDEALFQAMLSAGSQGCGGGGGCGVTGGGGESRNSSGPTTDDRQPHPAFYSYRPSESQPVLTYSGPRRAEMDPRAARADTGGSGAARGVHGGCGGGIAGGDGRGTGGRQPPVYRAHARDDHVTRAKDLVTWAHKRHAESMWSNHQLVKAPRQSCAQPHPSFSAHRAVAAVGSFGGTQDCEGMARMDVVRQHEDGFGCQYSNNFNTATATAMRAPGGGRPSQIRPTYQEDIAPSCPPPNPSQGRTDPFAAGRLSYASTPLQRSPPSAESAWDPAADEHFVERGLNQPRPVVSTVKRYDDWIDYAPRAQAPPRPPPRAQAPPRQPQPPQLSQQLTAPQYMYGKSDAESVSGGGGGGGGGGGAYQAERYQGCGPSWYGGGGGLTEPQWPPQGPGEPYRHRNHAWASTTAMAGHQEAPEWDLPHSWSNY